MILIEKNLINTNITNLYRKLDIQFPIIYSVLSGSQKGKIFHNKDFTHFFVIHNFGFSQEFYIDCDSNFAKKIEEFILSRNYKKLRLYAPSKSLSSFITNINFAEKSSRIRFTHQIFPRIYHKYKYIFTQADKNNIKNIDFGLDLFDRYWNGTQDYLINANAIVAYDGDKPIGICYSVANLENLCEIDIFVDEAYRKQNLGYEIGRRFIENISIEDFKPTWDCYANNYASINLAKKLGFIEKYTYDFYNIIGEFIE